MDEINQLVSVKRQERDLRTKPRGSATFRDSEIEEKPAKDPEKGWCWIEWPYSEVLRPFRDPRPCSLLLDVFSPVSSLEQLTSSHSGLMAFTFYPGSRPSLCSHIPKEYITLWLERGTHQANDFQYLPSPFREHHCSLFSQCISFPLYFCSFRDVPSLEYQCAYNYISDFVMTPSCAYQTHSQSPFIRSPPGPTANSVIFHCSFHLKFIRDFF